MVFIAIFYSFSLLSSTSYHFHYPLGPILLFVFTLSTSLLIAKVNFSHSVENDQIIAGLQTYAICIFVYHQATNQKGIFRDLTSMAPKVWVPSLLFMLYNIISEAYGLQLQNKVIEISILIAVSFFMIMFIQILFGGRQKHFVFEEESYVMSAFIKYLCIINIYLQLMTTLDL